MKRADAKPQPAASAPTNEEGSRCAQPWEVSSLRSGPLAYLLDRLTVVPPPPDTPVSTPCALWMGARRNLPAGKMGGGIVTYRKRVWYVHRLIWEFTLALAQHRGDSASSSSDGLDLRPMCGRTTCVNPDHRCLVERRERLRSLPGVCQRFAATTHCPRGHAYNEENTYTSPKGFRHCRKCGRDRALAHYRSLTPEEKRERARRQKAKRSAHISAGEGASATTAPRRIPLKEGDCGEA
jgi:hypothetical protein